MRLLLSLTLVLLPVPLIALAIRAGHLRTLPGPLVALAGVYGFMFLGSPIVVYQPGLYSDAFTYSLLGILLVFVALYAFLFGVQDKLKIDWDRYRPLAPTNTSLILVGSLWLYAGLTFALYTSRHGLPALFSIDLTSQALDVYAIRAEKSTDLAEGMHWYKLGMQTVPLLIFVYTYAWSIFSRTRIARFAFWLSLPGIVLMLNSFATKDGIVYLAEYAIIVGLVTGRLRLGSGRLWILVFGGIGSIFVWLRIYMLDRTTVAVLQTFGEYLVGRTVGAYIEAHAYAIRLFPDQHAYFMGRAFANPGGLLPFTPIDFSRFLGLRVFGQVANYASPSFTQGYANFGWLGLALIGLLMCLQLVLIQLVFRRLPKNVLVFTLYVYVVGRMIGYGRQSIVTIVSIDVVVVVIGFAALYVLCSALLERYSRRELSLSPGQDSVIHRWSAP